MAYVSLAIALLRAIMAKDLAAIIQACIAIIEHATSKATSAEQYKALEPHPELRTYLAARKFRDK